MSKIISPQSMWLHGGLAVIRIITGLLMAYHGWEIFDPNKMKEYLTWDVIKNLPAAEMLVYTGKLIELVTGILFVLGLFTKISAVLMAVNMLFICFKVGQGRFYYEDQHPFLFALLALVFFFTGPGRISLDNIFFGRHGLA